MIGNKIKASGGLRHCFHNPYHAIVALAFASPDDRKKVEHFFVNFTVSDKDPRALMFIGTSEKLKDVKKLIESFRNKKFKCGKDPIDSIKYSIDYGPTFEIEICV